MKKELAALFKTRMYHELDKKKQKYHDEIVDFSKLLEENITDIDENSIACYDIMADVKSKDRKKYLDKYKEMIEKYIN